MCKFKYLYKSLIIISMIFFSVAFSAKAQQEPQYTNYMFNQQPNNPAYTGSKGKASATLLTRLQWVGLDGAPRTTSFSFQTPLPRNKMGLGLTVISDEHGPVQNLYVNADYAYHIAINKVNRIAFGLSVGFYNYHVSLNQVPINSAAVMGQNDAAFDNAYQNNFQPNVGVGIYYYGSRLTAGISSPKLLSSRLSTSSDNQIAATGLRQHYFIMANYVIPLSETVNFRPGFSEKLVHGAPPSTDLTAQFSFKEIIVAGATYRIGDAVAALVALQATSQILVGYSYDYATTTLNDFNRGTHEFFLTYSFQFPKKNPCSVEPLFYTYKRKQKVVKNGRPLH